MTIDDLRVTIDEGRLTICLLRLNICVNAGFSAKQTKQPGYERGKALRNPSDPLNICVENGNATARDRGECAKFCVNGVI